MPLPVPAGALPVAHRVCKPSMCVVSGRGAGGPAYRASEDGENEEEGGDGGDGGNGGDGGFRPVSEGDLVVLRNAVSTIPLHERALCGEIG